MIRWPKKPDPGLTVLQVFGAEQDSTDSAIARIPKFKVDIPCRSQMTRLASITSYWARLSKPNQPSYKDGVMGEMGHWTQPILFRF